MGNVHFYKAAEIGNSIKKDGTKTYKTVTSPRESPAARHCANLLRRASIGHYNLIDHITTSATTMPTKQYATQTLVMDCMAWL